jgi:hypothetical protein
VNLEITSALRILYGEDVFTSPALLKILHPDSLKAVFRQRALELHPDRAFTLGKSPEEMSEAFKDVKLAYEMLNDLLGHSLEKTEYKHRKTPPERARPIPGSQGDLYWEAAIPEVNMLFGQFLYYAGLITINCLVSAIAWQRLQRPSFGRIARTWEYLSDDEVLAVTTSRKSGEKIGDAALRLGYLNRFQRNSVLGFQKYLQRPIGEYFKKIGLLKEDEIDYLVGLMRKHNREMGRKGQS